MVILPTLENSLRVGHVPDAPSNFEERACDSTHHPSEKCGCGYVNPDFVSALPDVQSENSSYRVIHTGVQFLRIAAKIVEPDQLISCFPHPFDVQPLPVKVGVPGSKRVLGSKHESIAIIPVDGAKSAVELGSNSGSFQNADIGRQNLVQSLSPSFGGNLGVAIEMAYLPSRVRAAIGSARSYNLAILARDSANSFCQCALDCFQSSLRGPAAKIGSVVRDD